MKKNDKKGLIITLITIIVLLSLTCIVSITYNFIGGFYGARIIKFNAMLGEKQTILVDGEGAFSVSCNFSGSLVLDENFKQEIIIDVRETENPLFFRAKAFISGINENVKMTGITNWILADDNYFYFNQSINNLEKIYLCKYLMFDMDLELEGNKDYIMTFMVETSEVEWNYTAVL